MNTYRKEHPLTPSKLNNGLLIKGTEREVEIEGMDYPIVVECFSILEAAEALGKATITLRKWLADDLIPGPILKNTTRGFKYYSVGELELLAKILAEHEQNHKYFGVGNEETKHRIMQRIHAYRMEYV